MEKVDVCIVGAGFAGLAAALKLKKEDLTVCILEARNRVGGRVYTEILPDGTALDWGGTFHGEGHSRLSFLAKEYGCELQRTPKGDKLIFMDGKTYRFSGSIPRINPLALADLALAIKNLDLMAKKVPLDGPWKAENAAEWDMMSLGQWIDHHTLSKKAKTLLNSFCIEIFSSDPHEISLLHALFMIHSLKSLEWIISDEGGAQQDLMVGGMQTLANRMADGLKESLHLNCPVTKIVQNENQVVIYAQDIMVEASEVIVATSPVMAGRIDYEPSLPQLRNQLTDRSAVGQIIRCYAVYQTPFWRFERLSGLALDADEVPQACIDTSLSEHSKGVITSYIWGPPARHYATLSPEERKKTFIKGLVKRFGKKAENPIHYAELDWSEEKWSRGAVFGHYGPSVVTGFGSAIRKPCGRIHWAGTETSIQWCGTIEGAIISGERAAEEITSSYCSSNDSLSRSKKQ